MKLRKFAGIALSLSATALLLAGCSGTASDPVGTWGSDAEGKPQLVLESDGKLTGTDGCNRLMGTWKEADGQVEFIQVASTLMACQNVDTWLSELDTAKVDGNTLHVLDVDGEEIGSLAKS